MNKLAVSLCLLNFFVMPALFAQKNYTVQSPSKNITVTVTSGDMLEWSAIDKDGDILIAPSAISMTLSTGQVLGRNLKPGKHSIRNSNTTIDAHFYKKDSIDDNFNELVIPFRDRYNYSLVVRAYDNGIAYRFIIGRKDSLMVMDEEANFNFNQDYNSWVPYVNGKPNANKDKYHTSFENTYQYGPISKLKQDTLCFAPLLVDIGNGKKIAITEADLEEYPGMFLKPNGNSFKGEFAPYPATEKQGGHNNLQSFVQTREKYIAVRGIQHTKTFPWRVVIYSTSDKELLNNDLVYSLAFQNQLSDISWIKPGKVAWDWWNDWNISKVNFKAGINTETYKYYIDFAAKNKIEYVLLDEGWAVSTDLMQIVPAIDLKEIVRYATEKNIGIWLWGGWKPMDQKMDEVMKFYSQMGIKGFKIDFMDRDDQKMVEFYYRTARRAADFKLMVDFHGAYKPTGLQRTYPNVVNFEGVFGLEQLKWTEYKDMPVYDVTMPFIRMLAGPMDYTEGAMRNANKKNWRAVYSKPMSQGTRCHQLALYVLLESPFLMLCDDPTAYEQEKECTDFMASIPTTFDETIALDGKVGEYASVARRKGDTWYICGMNNWSARQFSVPLTFLKEGTKYSSTLMVDGINASRDATDYKKIAGTATRGTIINGEMAEGGGWVMILEPIKPRP